MSLDQNLRLATQVAMSVRKAIPRSANSKESGSPLLESGMAVNSVSWGMLNAQRARVGRKLPKSDKAWNKSLNKMAKAARKSGAGNCGEVAGVACLELKKRGGACVEYVQVEDGQSSNSVVPHVIAVLGRDPDGGATADFTNVGTPDTWHPNAVICDPWARIAYAAKDYQDFWDGLKSYSDDPEGLYCVVLHRL